MNTRCSMLAASALTVISVFALLESSTAYAGRPRAGQTVNRSVSRTGVEGRTASRATSKTITENGYQRSSIATGPRGNTATRDATGAYNADTKTFTRDASSTGPRGNTTSTNAVTQKTENGYSRDVSHTGVNGNTSTKSVDVQKTDTGYTRDVTKTGPNGATSTVTREVTKPTQP